MFRRMLFVFFLMLAVAGQTSFAQKTFKKSPPGQDDAQMLSLRSRRPASAQSLI